MDKITIKQLSTQIAKLETDIKIQNDSIKLQQKQMSLSVNRLKKLKNQLNKLKDKGELIVSEHAILRFLERVKGIDIELLKKEIKNEDIMELYTKLGGNGKYPCSEFKVVVKDNVIVTVE